MDGEKLTTSLYCLQCQEEVEHEIIYRAGIVQSIICKKCGLEIGFDKKKLLALYGEELVERVLTKPRRLSEEYEKDLTEFLKNLPLRILTKPYRMLKELESFRDS
ncbi:MAG: hypothetical protein PWP60_1171 [Candidatus Atribacteria bacterium]|uniref:Bh protein n=1 Tax=Thermatribacter velox TaxID=3039681 RepID=A0ABZ2YD66_9BACT|nr:hypothetical protein [Candidatus Atribacteria bacterium]MDI3531322.1 hypothetical protein [Candidatus Atribacteria bacterium]